MVLYANTFFQIISLFYIVLIGGIFFVKKKMPSAENYIFRNLIIVGFFCVILDIASIVSAFQIPDSIFTMIFAKTYLISLAIFCIIYTNYAVIITNNSLNNEEKLDQYKKTRFIYIGITILCALAIIIAPVSIYTRGTNVMYSYGPATSIAYIICGISIFLWIALLIVRVRNLAARKTFPIVGVIVFGGLAALVQLFNPQILLVTAALAYSISIMYFSVFTIENPDLEMIEEIKVARNDAIKASNAKSEFLSSMSHELRTPLNAILGFSQGLLEQNLDSQIKDDVEDIVSAADTLLELVNEVLDISKIESEKFEIIDVEYAVNKVYKYLVTMTEGRIGSRQLEFIHEYDKNMPPVLYGDCVRIKQIIVNLLTNSVKYTKEGYVKLAMNYEKIDDEVGYLVVSVSDSGIGIKEEDLKKLFSKFSRLDMKQNVNIEGTGLGLALTKNLVDLMGGEIKVESKYGVGSTFTIKLKQKIVHKTAEDIEQIDPLVARGTFTGQGEKILVVDDNNVNLKVASRFLKNYQLELDFATSGKECIDKIASGRHYDLILLDDQMPGMTGVETIKHLKDIVGFHVPTIALTANAISGMKEKYMECGFDDYLSKPIDKILLDELLVKFLGNKKNTTIPPAPIETSGNGEPLKPETTPVTVPETTPETMPQQVAEKQEEIEELDWDNEPQEKSTEPVEEKKIEEEVVEEKQEEITSSFQGDPVHSREYLESFGLDINKALETLMDMDIYADTAVDVLDDSDNKMADLKKYLEANDMKNYCVVAHALKSDAKYMGMMKLADLAYKHELASKEENVEEIKSSFDELIELTKQMMDILRKFLGREK